MLATERQSSRLWHVNTTVFDVSSRKCQISGKNLKAEPISGAYSLAPQYGEDQFWQRISNKNIKDNVANFGIELWHILASVNTPFMCAPNRHGVIVICNSNSNSDWGQLYCNRNSNRNRKQFLWNNCNSNSTSSNM